MVTTSAVLDGVAGGLVATIVMTIVMMVAGDDSPPPTAAFWAKYVGGGKPDEYMMPGMVLHLLYGIGAGTVFAVALPLAGLSSSLVMTIAYAVGYAIVLTIVGAAFWMNVVLAMDPEPKQVGMFAVLHLIYGVALGAIVGAGLV
jgi:hypothetical protein